MFRPAENAELNIYKLLYAKLRGRWITAMRHHSLTMASGFKGKETLEDPIRLPGCLCTRTATLPCAPGL